MDIIRKNFKLLMSRHIDSMEIEGNKLIVAKDGVDTQHKIVRNIQTDDDPLLNYILSFEYYLISLYYTLLDDDLRVVVEVCYDDWS